MSDAATLVHDVGKYIARIARNVRPGELVPPALIPMLVRDLYELPGKKRASERFEEIAASLPADAILDRTRERLAHIDALEADVRRNDADACRTACTLALEVEALLRVYAGAPPR